ncbi:MAG: hypothetical protein ABGY41_06760 [Candidatus Poribacteria bacterium]
MPSRIASVMPDMSALGDSGAWGGVVVLAMSLPIGVGLAWVLQRRSSARLEATRQRHDRLIQAAVVGAASPSDTPTGARANTRASWRKRVVAAGRGRR